jgi:exopolysaccharide production protein ExoY
MTRPSDPEPSSTSAAEPVLGQFEPAQPSGSTARPRRPSQPIGPVDLETRDPAGRVQLQLQLQRRAPKNLRLHFRRTVARFATLALADLLTFWAVRELGHLVRDQQWLGTVRAGSVLQAILASASYLDGAQYALALVVGLWVTGNYGWGDQRRDPFGLLAAVAVATAVVFWTPVWQQGLAALTLGYALAAGIIWLALVAERFSLNLTLERLKQWRSPAARTLVVGCDEDYDRLRRGPALNDTREVAVIGFVDVARPPAAQAIGHVDDLAHLLEEHHIDTVLVCGYVTDQAFREIADKSTAAGCRLLSVPRSFDLGGLQPSMLSWHGQALVELTAPSLKVPDLVLKRCLDLVAAGLGLVVLAPLFALVGLAIKLESRGPLIFGHRRLGLNGRSFKCYKFRSMHADAEQRLRSDPTLYARYVVNSYKLPEDEDPRLTRMGRVLRKTSLDELPQLFNVLKGEMSLVGPRPIVPEELGEYGRGGASFLSLKPGITGAWQVSGRSRVGYPDRADIELDYVRRWSLGRDVRIILRTLPAVVVARGAH